MRGKCLVVPLLCMLAPHGWCASVLDTYYAHPAQHDVHGVIAPWHKGQNGPLDERLRIAIDVCKRSPWVLTDKAVMAAPDFVYNSHWRITDNGDIQIPPTNDWMCGDLSQRAWSTIKGLTDYYRYRGGPTGPQRMVFGYMERKDYVDSRGNVWRPGTEFVIRAGYGKDSVAEALWTERRTMYIALDVAEAAGGRFRALERTFENITPRNGIIEVKLTGCDGREAILQALELAPMPPAK